MNRLVHRLSLCFAAGSAGGLANSLTVWLSGQYGLTTALGVRINPQLTSQWLYPRLVWGGLWGLLFLLPLMSRHWIARGLIFSLGPSLVQLLYIFPYQAAQGMMGTGLGILTPVFVLLFNAVWGLFASAWLQVARG